jgi:aryl-alcohol dehydrogenase-like predicted oxidoreductase
MEYRRLGKTELSVSALGFGGWAIGGSEFGNSYGPTDDATSVQAIHVALDLGCNFFDTADVYGRGRSELLLGRALLEAGKLHDVVVASKVGSNFLREPAIADFSKEHMLSAIDATLGRLKRDYVDLYQLHNPPLEVIQEGTVFDVLESLKTSGKIRHHGVSIHTVVEGVALIDGKRTEALQLVYNLFSLMEPDSSTATLFPRAVQEDLGLIAREPLANGFLSGGHKIDTFYPPGDMRADLPADARKLYVALAERLRWLERPGVTLAQAALRFVLDEPAVATAIVGMKTPRQARENFAAVNVPTFASIAKRDCS